MTCDQLAPLLVSRPLGLLEPARETQVAAHLEGCPGCQGFAREVDEALEGARLPAPQAPAPADQDPPGWGRLCAELEAAARRSALRIHLACAWCHDALARGAGVYCASCLTPHHAECFSGHGACSAPGCGETLFVRPGAMPRPVRRRAWVAAIAAAAVGVGAVAAWRPGAGDPGPQKGPQLAQAGPDQVPIAQPKPVEEPAAQGGEPLPVRPLPVRPLPVEPLPGQEPPQPCVRFSPAPTGELSGAVLAVQGGGQQPARVLISLGADDGVAEGFRFDVLRGEQRVGGLVVVDVQRDGARCRPAAGDRAAQLQVGDPVRLVGTDRVRVEGDGRDVRDASLELAGLVGVELILPPDVHGPLTLHVEAPWRSALEQMLGAAGEFELVDEGEGRLRVTRRGAESEPAPARTLQVTPGADGALALIAHEVELAEVLEAIGKAVGRNLLVDPSVQQDVDLELQEPRAWREIVDLLARTYGCQVDERPGGILVLSRPALVTLECRDRDVREAIQEVARRAGANVIIAPELQGRVTTTIKEVHWLRVLYALVKACGPYEVVEEGGGLLRIVPRTSIRRQLETRIVKLEVVAPPATELRRLLETAVRQRTEEDGLASVRVEYDQAANALVLTGPRPALVELERLIQQAERGGPKGQH